MTTETAGAWLEHSGRRIAVDARGYLADPADWSEALAEAMAERDGIVLSEAHWQVLHILRGYFAGHGRSPPMRVLVKEIGSVRGRADSRALYRLFPDGPAKQAARYAGLPRPTSCI